MALWGYGISSKASHDIGILIFPSEQNERRGGASAGVLELRGARPERGGVRALTEVAHEGVIQAVINPRIYGLIASESG